MNSNETKTALDRPAVYIGTYAKYNSGSISGDWFYIDDYADASDLYEAAREFHKDESDPELMIQDFQAFPRRFYCESFDLETLGDLYEYFESVPEDQREAFEAFVEWVGGEYATFSDFENSYQGRWDYFKYFADDIAEEMGYYDALEKVNSGGRYYFDLDAFARDLENDYFYDEKTGSVFLCNY